MLFFLKFWDNAFSQIIVNLDQLQKIQTLIKSQKSNVILVPTNRSFLDLWLLSFVHQQQGIQTPFVCGDSQLFALAFISQFIKNSGGFKLDPKNANNELYQAVVDGYIYALLKNNQLIELYLEEQRSRSGKVQAPNEALFDRIIKMYFNGNSDMQHKDIQFVPVTINYDRIVEGD